MTWLEGPAVQIIVQLDSVKPGDCVRAESGREYLVVARNPSYKKMLRGVKLNRHSGQGEHAYLISRIVAWCRPPLDIEL